MILDVNLGENSYPIIIEKDSLSKAGDYIVPKLKGDKIGILTDENVDKYYGDVVLNSIASRGVEVFKIVIKPGEESKNINTALYVYEELLKHEFSRKDLLITLGGGVVGDLGGYCASTYLRGVDFYQIPTSLLAQIDSSVGGKVAIDLPYGKNLVGAFYQPKGVLIDENTLRTLEEKYFIDGMGEAIKYGAIFSEGFFSYLEEEAFTLKDVKEGKSMGKVIYDCCNFKRIVVEEDEKEQGRRALLNFGHTVGHSIEKVQAYKGYSHGEAVAIGMIVIAKAGESLGVTEKGTTVRLEKLIKKTGLPAIFPVEILDEVVKGISLDKKAQGKKVGMVGDGINDAPALAVADIGIAVGSGTDIAIESADIILMKPEISDVLRALSISRLTIKVVKENLFWAFIYNILAIPVAMGVLYLFGGPLLNPMIAGLAMGFSSVSVVLNALRLKYMTLK